MTYVEKCLFGSSALKNEVGRLASKNIRIFSGKRQYCFGFDKGIFMYLYLLTLCQCASSGLITFQLHSLVVSLSEYRNVFSCCACPTFGKNYELRIMQKKGQVIIIIITLLKFNSITQLLVLLGLLFASS